MSKATKTASATKPAKPAKSAEQIEAEAIAKAEAKLHAKYPGKVVEGSVRRADASNPDEAKYGKKMLCTINTKGIDGQFDGKTRTVATSDVFQVHHQPEVVAQLRKARNADKRKARKEASADKPSVEDAAAALGV